MEPLTILATAVIGVIALYYLFLNPFDYWKKRGIPYLERQFPIIGTLRALYLPVNEVVHYYYESLPQHKFYGTFLLWKPIFIVKDPELIEHILIRDFPYFYNRSNVVDPDSDPLAKHLVNYHDEQWKALRSKLTPTFTSGKLKGMHSQLVQGAESFAKYLDRFKRNDEIEMRDLFGRFSMDVVASCAFGLDLDIMNNPKSEFYEIGKSTFKPSYFTKIFFSLQIIVAPIFKLLKIGLIPKYLTNFFSNAIATTLEYREKNDIKRPDFLHLLNELKKKDEELVKKNQMDPKDPLFFDQVSLVANAFVFLAAGYETTASSLGYFFYQLALDPEIQEKIYEEIIAVSSKHKGEMSFDAIGEMNYLEWSISESLRLNPPGTMTERLTTKDYAIPGSDDVLPAGVPVYMPLYSLHHDPQYFPEPKKFIPERFDTERNSIKKGTYFPFGAGPRMCIAARFARLEMKVCAAVLLRQYRVHSCSKTEKPLKYNPRSFMLTPLNGIWLSLEKRTAPAS